MASVAEIEKKISDAKFTIKGIDDKLKRLRDQLRAYTSAKNLTAAQTESAKKLTKQIAEEEAKKTEAESVLRYNEPKIKDLRALESIDNEIEREIAAYNKATALGQTFNKSRVNSLYEKRKALAGNLSGLAPEAPKFPSVKPTTVSNAPTGQNVPATTTTATAEKPTTTTTAAKPTTTNKPVTTGTMPELPTGGPTGVVGAGFNPAQVRAGEEASTGAARPAGVVTPTQPTDLQTLLKKTEFWYDLPDYLFQTVPGLGDLLLEAVNDKTGVWSNAKFESKLKLLPWWQSNAETFRNRLIDKAKYDELKAQGQDVSKTDYGQYIAKQIRNVKAQAKSIAGVSLDDAQAQQIAEKIYNGNLDDDPLAINRLIIPFIGKVTDRYAGTDVTTYGGQALQSYQVLQGIAKANGLALKDILPQVSTTLTDGDLEKAVLQGLAAGDIDIQRIAQNARMVAAQGQPEYVRNLLNQGYDLEQIYAPYKKTMATLLELNQDQIDLNDPTLRNAINNNGDMNVYDFKKTIRKDPRWQYTENARQDVSNVALQVLRDFGFQGR